MNKKNLLLVTILLALGLLAVAVSPVINALANNNQKNMVECEAGYEIVQLSNGRIRIVGDCSVKNEQYSPTRPDNDVIESPSDKDPYPEIYPYPEVEYPPECIVRWIYGQPCDMYPEQPIIREPYPVPDDDPSPYIENPCDRDWYMGQECEP
jgi:hypothetical protein